MDMELLAQQVLKNIFIELEASGRHVHVTKEQAMTLFGHSLTAKRPLSQPGQYLSNERVTVKGPKGEFTNVAVLGPERKEAQVEISLTDGRTLGLTPPVRPSGDVTGSPGAGLMPFFTISAACWAVISLRWAPSVNCTPQLFSSRFLLAMAAPNARFADVGSPGS